MSRVLASRIAKLEAKRKPPQPKPFYVVGKVIAKDGVFFDGLGLPIPNPGEWQAKARLQQENLLRALNEYADQFDEEGNSDGRDTSPHVGIELAPLLPGKTKRPRFIEIDGQEIDAEAWRALRAQRN